MDATKYTDDYLKAAYGQAARIAEHLPNNKVAQKIYGELLAEMKRRGFIKSN